MKIVEKIMYLMTVVTIVLCLMGLLVGVFIMPPEEFPTWYRVITLTSLFTPLIYDEYRKWKYKQKKKKWRRGRY